MRTFLPKKITVPDINPSSVLVPRTTLISYDKPPTLKGIIKRKKEGDVWIYNGIFSSTKYHKIKEIWIEGVFPKI